MFIFYFSPDLSKPKAVLFPQAFFLKGQRALASMVSEYLLEQLKVLFESAGQAVLSLQQTALLVPQVEGSDPSAPGMQ
jgi:hypothetical protein